MIVVTLWLALSLPVGMLTGRFIHLADVRDHRLYQQPDTVLGGVGNSFHAQEKY